MIQMADYNSSHTGKQIDDAVDFYLKGNTRSTFIVTTSWNSSTTQTKGRYYFDISATGLASVGPYPDVFLVNDAGEKYIPEVTYSRGELSEDSLTTTIRVFSYINIPGSIVVSGGGIREVKQKT